jgi:DnaK suppressor protein
MTDLSKQQLQALKENMRAGRDVLRDGLEDALRLEGHANLVENMDRVHDTGDDAVADVLADLNVAHLVAEYDELRDLDAALLRVESGTYGDCIDCGEPIPFERLETMPTALRCVDCQEKFEQEANRGRKDSTPSL